MRTPFNAVQVGQVFVYGKQRYKKTPARISPTVSNAINLGTGKPARFGGQMTSAPAVIADAGVVQIEVGRVRELETHCDGGFHKM